MSEAPRETESERGGIAASVIVPVFNGADTIGECLASLLALDYPPSGFEIVVVDNGSTDGTAAVVAGLGGRVRLLHEPVRGASAARNRGVRAARGRLVAFTDADCAVEPHWLARLVEPSGPLPTLAGVLAVLGHMYPVWLRFRGGKGVATGAGAFLPLAPLATVCALAAFGCGGAASNPTAPPTPAVAATPPPAPRVLIVSVDGLRPDAIFATATPTLRDLIARGSSTMGAQTIHPSNTLPSHTSMLTGLAPSTHGVTWNSDRTDELGVVTAPTIFALAKQSGFTTAAFFSKSKFHHLQQPGSP